MLFLDLSKKFVILTSILGLDSLIDLFPKAFAYELISHFLPEEDALLYLNEDFTKNLS